MYVLIEQWTDTCHLICPLASILAEPSLLSDLLRVLRYAIPSISYATNEAG